MKKSLSSIVVVSLFLTFVGCSSVKVVDTWTADEVSGIYDKNILVIAKTDNKQARIAFEEGIASGLRRKGLNATESFKKFPKIDPDRQQTEEDVERVVKILEAEGFQSVMVSALVDYEQTTVREESGGYYAGASYYPAYYPGYYHGFYGYYGGRYSTFGTYVPSTTTTRTSKKYVLETVAYDLEQPQNRQLVAVITSEVTDPSSVQETADEYAKNIVKRIVK